MWWSEAQQAKQWPVAREERQLINFTLSLGLPVEFHIAASYIFIILYKMLKTTKISTIDLIHNKLGIWSIAYHKEISISLKNLTKLVYLQQQQWNKHYLSRHPPRAPATLGKTEKRDTRIQSLGSDSFMVRSERNESCPRLTISIAHLLLSLLHVGEIINDRLWKVF